jgi:16S rRNA pseudouridine516 synthase
MMRLDKLLADCTALTRSQAGKAIRDGRVQVDGCTVTSPDRKIDELSVKVMLDGQYCGYQAFHYYILDKPKGILTASRDRKQKTVMDLFPPEIRKQGIFPVGRLDKDTSGLLLLTDDGEFAHRILSPKSLVRKVYLAQVEGELCDDDIQRFHEGLILADGTKCLPAELEILAPNQAKVTVCEGKYHQVRRMLAAVGKPVSELRRISVGNLQLDPGLKEGCFAEVEESDLCILFSTLNMGK